MCDGESATFSINLGKKRINQADILNIFSMTEEYHYTGIQIDDDILKKHGLETKRYITIHRGVDTDQVNNSVKLWPVSFYNNLILQIRRYFPEFKIIQLGVSHARCETMENIDLNLVEETTLSEVGALLKNAWLHVDCEGGLVHLRHALKGGKSAVIFGPTSPNFFGYSENINVRSSACPYPCEWMTENWQETCPRYNQKHLCMTSLHADIVMSEIEKSI